MTDYLNCKCAICGDSGIHSAYDRAGVLHTYPCVCTKRVKPAQTSPFRSVMLRDDGYCGTTDGVNWVPLSLEQHELFVYGNIAKDVKRVQQAFGSDFGKRFSAWLKGETMKFEVGKLYKTRNGKIRRVVCIDVPAEQPVVSVIATQGDAGVSMNVREHYSDGKVGVSGEHGYDLVAEHVVPREWAIPEEYLKKWGYSRNPDDRLEPGYDYVRVREVLPE